MDKVWLIASGKGGTGKSTLTVNLGTALAATGRRILLVDLAIGLRCLDLCLGLADRVLFDIMDVLDGNCRPRDAILKHPNVPGLFLLPASQTRRSVDLDGTRLRSLCAMLSSDYDLILMDCPPGVEPVLGQAARAAGQSILVATQDPAALRDTDRVAVELSAEGLTRVYLVLNRFRIETVQKMQMPKAAELAEMVGIPLLGSVPEDSAVSNATLLGEIACAKFPDAPASVAYHTMARRIPWKD